ncbi:hypothetical protein MBLNU13_g11205t1 [Cladosporium sp. NU13]
MSSLSQHPEPPINLLRGWPASTLLPTTLIKHAALAALNNPQIATAALSYGPDPGYEPARVAIAQWLTDSYATPSPISPDRLCITGGASQNLGSLMGVYTDPAYTRAIWIVAPAYFLSFRIFEDAGFGGKMRAVPEDAEGVDIAFLEREVRKSEEQRQQGVHACRVLRAVVCEPFVEDDELTSTGAAGEVGEAWPAAKHGRGLESGSGSRQEYLPRLVDVDRDIDGGAERDGADGFGNACSNGSFSKIAGPGVRCGWVEGTKKLAYGASQTGTTCSGGAPSQLTSTFMTHLLQTGQLQDHIKHTLQPAYATNYRALHDAITTHLLPLGFTLPQPTRDVVGGFFVWLSLPEGIAAGEFAQVCKEEEGVIVAPGAMFEVPGDEAVKFDGNVRLCFAWEEERRLVEGVKRMEAAAEKVIAAVKGRGSGEYVLVEKGDIGGGVDEFK